MVKADINVGNNYQILIQSYTILINAMIVPDKEVKLSKFN